jgi:hypothetical protein
MTGNARNDNLVFSHDLKFSLPKSKNSSPECNEIAKQWLSTLIIW